MDLALFRDTSNGPQRPNPTGSGPGDRDPVREPMFNAPWPALALVAIILGGYAIQSRLPPLEVNYWAFMPADLTHGRWETLVTSLFLHGGWGHAVMNAAFALAFASPAARFFGERATGVLCFFLFYLACGVLASLGYAALHPGGVNGLVGASGAVSGLMALAARLLAGHGGLGPIRSKMVLGMGGAWVGVNLLIALIGSALIPGAAGAAIAWEAHIAGFLAGLLLSGPFAWLARRG